MLLRGISVINEILESHETKKEKRTNELKNL
jgi:hypothetical protein